MSPLSWSVSSSPGFRFSGFLVLGFKVWGLGFRFSGFLVLGFKVWGLGFNAFGV